jgi:hypothetical protein
MIKAKDGVRFWQNESGKWHVLKRRGGTNVYSGICSAMYHDRIELVLAEPNKRNESEMCKHCLKFARKRGLIEEVIDKPVQDPIKAQLHEYECRAKNAEDEVAELRAANDELNEDDAKQVELVCKLGREVTELKETVKRLERANHCQQDNLDKVEKELAHERECHNVTINTWQAFESATNGHALENVKRIMGAFKPRDFEGVYIDSVQIKTTPIVEYIPTEEITDELCEELGRIECEVQDGHDPDRWIGSGRFLVAVNPEEYPPRFLTMRGSREEWRHCRIKRSTIERLRGAK